MIYSQTSLGKISKIGLGTVQFGLDYGLTRAKKQSEVDKILNVALKQGINFLDTARDYGNSEEKIGSFIKRHKKAGFVIATKLARLDYAIFQDASKLKKYFKQSIERSLNALGVDRISLLQLHQTDQAILENPIFWNVIHELKGEGSFEIFGISCYQKQEIDFVQNNLGRLLGAVQAPMNVLDARMNSVSAVCQAKKTLFIARSIFLKGVLTMASKNLPEELKDLRKYREELDRIAQESGLSVARIAVLSVVARESVTCAILGVNSGTELLENTQTLEAMGHFKKLKLKLNFPVMRDEKLLDPRTWKSL